MERDYNKDLCVVQARLVSQCREPKSLLPISIFHSCFGGAQVSASAPYRGWGVSALRRADHRAWRLRSGPETVRKVCQRVAPGGAGAGPHLLEPGFVPPPTPPPPRPLTSGKRVHPSDLFGPSCSRERPLPHGPCTLLCLPPGQRHFLALDDPAAAECQVR